MPMHPDFKKMYDSMIKQYGEDKGDDVYYATINKKKLDDTKPMPKEGFKEKTLTVNRVGYGKSDTPKEDLEYQIDGQGPVGTMKEWEDWAKDNGYSSVKFVEDYKERLKEMRKSEDFKPSGMFGYIRDELAKGKTEDDVFQDLVKDKGFPIIAAKRAIDMAKRGITEDMSLGTAGGAVAPAKIPEKKKETLRSPGDKVQFKGEEVTYERPAPFGWGFAVIRTKDGIPLEVSEKELKEDFVQIGGLGYKETLKELTQDRHTPYVGGQDGTWATHVMDKIFDSFPNEHDRQQAAFAMRLDWIRNRDQKMAHLPTDEEIQTMLDDYNAGKRYNYDWWSRSGKMPKTWELRRKVGYEGVYDTPDDQKKWWYYVQGKLSYADVPREKMGAIIATMLKAWKADGKSLKDLPSDYEVSALYSDIPWIKHRKQEPMPAESFKEEVKEDWAKFIIGHALADIKTKADAQRVIDDVEGTALAQRPDLMAIFKDLVDKRIAMLRKEEYKERLREICKR